MHRKMLVAFFAVFGLVLSAQARYINDDFNEDNGVLPLPFYNNFDSKESEEGDTAVPNINQRFGGAVDYDVDREATNGVVLRNKFGLGGNDGNDNGVEKKQPGWLKRQWRRLGNAVAVQSYSKTVSPAKVAEFTERVCNGLKTMVNRAAKICEVVPLKFCASFYESKDADSIILPEPNSLEM